MKKVMVCVTRQKTCKRLIEFGKKMIADDGELLILHVVKNGAGFLGGKEDSEALEYLCRVAVENGATLSVQKADHVKDMIVNSVKENEVSDIVVGAAPVKENQGDFITSLHNMLGEKVDMHVVPV